MATFTFSDLLSTGSSATYYYVDSTSVPKVNIIPNYTQKTETPKKDKEILFDTKYLDL